MQRLNRHIFRLLLENDCVIVPGFGGLFLNSSPAEYLKSEGVFLPPKKSVAFNRRLTMNDWLLAHSYMEQGQTGQDKAMKNLMDDISELRNNLSSKGKANLNDIGEFRLGPDSLTHFMPYRDNLTSPANYGLPALRINKLQNTSYVKKTLPAPKKTLPDIVRIAISAAAVFLMLFAFATPTAHLPESGKALFGPDIKNIISVPVTPERTKKVTNLNATETNMVTTENNMVATETNMVTTENNMAATETNMVATETNMVTTENSMAATGTNMVVTETNLNTTENSMAVTETNPEEYQNEFCYHIIIASLPNLPDALETIEEFESEGFFNTSIIYSKGRFRIALLSFRTYGEAFENLSKIRQNQLFINAWIHKQI